MTTGPEPRIRTDRGLAAHRRRAPAAATNRSNTASASSGPGAPSGWYWTVSIGSVAWRRPSTEPSLRFTWLTWKPPSAGSESPITWTSWFWAVTWTSPWSTSRTGWFAPWCPNRSRAGLGARGARHDLVAEADPEQRPPVVDDRPGQRDGPVEPGRIARPRRQDHPVDVRRQRDGRRDRVRQDPDAGAAPPHAADDVRLQAEVDDRDERPAVLGPADVHDRRGRDLADEVLVLPARNGPRPLDRRIAVDEPGLGDDAAEAAVRPEVAGERPGVDAGDRRDAVAAEQRRELAHIVDDRGGRVGDDEAAEPRSDGLVVLDQPAVVADQRIGHDDDLAGVRGVGADLLVARSASC